MHNADKIIDSMLNENLDDETKNFLKSLKYNEVIKNLDNYVKQIQPMDKAITNFQHKYLKYKLKYFFTLKSMY